MITHNFNKQTRQRIRNAAAIIALGCTLVIFHAQAVAEPPNEGKDSSTEPNSPKKEEAKPRLYADPYNWQSTVKFYNAPQVCEDAHIDILFTNGALKVTYDETMPKSSRVGKSGVKIVAGPNECQITIDITPTSQPK